MKVSELKGALLDYWVCVSEGIEVIVAMRENYDDTELSCLEVNARGARVLRRSPSTSWVEGGPIIEREGIAFAKFYEPKDGPIAPGNEWAALSLDDSIRMDGPTPLVAAMRVQVAAYYGDEVPDEVRLG